jgi:hypothetical protein
MPNGAVTPEDLQQRLRKAWPESRVFGGITDIDGDHWDAYREGRWIDRSAAHSSERCVALTLIIAVSARATRCSGMSPSARAGRHDTIGS